MNETQLLDRLMRIILYSFMILSLFVLLIEGFPFISSFILPFLIMCGAVSGILGIAFPLPIEKVPRNGSPEFDTKIKAKDIFFSLIFGMFMMILFVIIMLALYNFMSGVEGAILILLFYGLVSFGVFFKVPQRAGIRIHGLFLRGRL